MNSRKSFYDVKSFYSKNAVLFASFRGMRYQVRRVEKSDDDFALQVVIWPEPFGFEKTPEEDKTYHEFAYSEDGLDELYEWVCGCYSERQEEWENS